MGVELERLRSPHLMLTHVGHIGHHVLLTRELVHEQVGIDALDPNELTGVWPSLGQLADLLAPVLVRPTRGLAGGACERGGRGRELRDQSVAPGYTVVDLPRITVDVVDRTPGGERVRVSAGLANVQ